MKGCDLIVPINYRESLDVHFQLVLDIYNNTTNEQMRIDIYTLLITANSGNIVIEGCSINPDDGYFKVQLRKGNECWEKLYKTDYKVFKLGM